MQSGKLSVRFQLKVIKAILSKKNKIKILVDILLKRFAFIRKASSVKQIVT